MNDVSSLYRKASLRLSRLLRGGALCCLLAMCLTGMAWGGGEDKAASRYRLVNGKGYSVCEAYLKNLNAFSPSDPPMMCEQKIHPMHPEFSLPQWELLDVNAHLKLAYEATMLLSPYSHADVKHPLFEDWKKEFLAKVKKQELAPRLRRTRLALNERGVETLILYEPDVRECERYRYSAGGHIFVLRDGEHPEPIDGIPGSQGHMGILLYRGKTFFVSMLGDPSWWMGLDAVSPIMSGRNQYISQPRCEFKFEE